MTQFVDRDWNNERFVTALELLQMPSWRRCWFIQQHNIWRAHPDRNVDALVNMAHPDNKGLAARDLLEEAVHA